jgi:HD-GYP domain-containing protein (c-di-GMP phosphodiesterase class II)
MKNNPVNYESETIQQGGDDGGLWDRVYRSQNILIPIELDTKNQVFGFFELVNQELPEGGQKNLNDITGTPFKPELAGITVYDGPVKPSLQDNYLKALIKLADSIDRCDQSAHSQQTAAWAQQIGRRMGLSDYDVRHVTLAGKLHDIGKAVVSRDLLTKPGPLSVEEWKIMRKHPAYGAALMEPSIMLEIIRPLVRWHHERFAGGGYPDGICGMDIPLGARILGVADAFSTMTTGRAYRAPISYEDALGELARCSGTQFDPEIVGLMFEIVTIH